MTTVVTVDELHALRRRNAELGSVDGRRGDWGTPSLSRSLLSLRPLGSATVDVVIRCLLCGAFGTFPAAVDDDATPQSAICSECDKCCWEGVELS